METHPSKLIEALEAIVERLLPPACREHVLGDLRERYKSEGQYLLDALAIIPLVIASQVRRTFDIQLFLAQAAALYISYAGASLIFGPGYLYDHSKLLPVAIVIGMALFVLVLCEAYEGPNRQSQRRPGPDLTAFLFIWFSQALIGNLKSEWILPVLLMLIGSHFSLLLLYIVRRLYRTVPRSPAALAGGAIASLDELRRRSEAAHKKAWNVNFVWLAASFVVLFASPDPSVIRAGHRDVYQFLFLFAVTVGTLIAYGRYRQGEAKISQEFLSVSMARDPHRTQLAGKRDSLRLWSGLRMDFFSKSGAVVRLLFILIGTGYLAVVLGWVRGNQFPANVDRTLLLMDFIGFVLLCKSWSLVKKLNEQAAQTIQEEIDALDAAEKTKNE
jgi:hypothetical protein